MTWPSSAPSSRTSSGERVAGAGGADAERLGGDGRRGRAAAARSRCGRCVRPRRSRVRAHATRPNRSASERTRVATFVGRNLSIRLYGDGRDDDAGPRRRPLGAPRRDRAARCRPGRAADQLEQLRFLHEVARLATTARTWDELLETVVDRTRDVLHADVSSLYLLDRDGAYLTWPRRTASTGSRSAGRACRSVRASPARSPRNASRWSSPTSRPTPRFLWVRGIDQRRFVASMLSRAADAGTTRRSGSSTSRPRQPRAFTDDDVAQLGAVADLLAGIIEKGRQQAEAEARVEALKAIDEARSELIALVTHELRTPLAVVRAYADLLADEPPLRGRESRDMERRSAAGGLASGDARADRAARSPGRLDPRLGPGRARRRRRRSPRSTSRRSSTRSSPRSGRSSSAIASRSSPGVRLHALADPPRLRQIVEHLVENAVKYAPPETDIRIDWTLAEGVVLLGVSDEGPGHPR